MSNNSQSMIRCEKMNKWYGGIHALKDVSVDIKKGESVGLVGDNGAGKSTFIKILSGVHKQDSGNFYFDGKLTHIKNRSSSNSNFGRNSNRYIMERFRLLHPDFSGQPQFPWGFPFLTSLNSPAIRCLRKRRNRC